MEERKENIVIGNIENVLHNSMMPYAEHVILERALPRVEDGLKPVQRRILYAMHELGLMPDKPHKKSARVVGECLAKYHPHGDSSVYEAMVRLAQPFNMRMTLVDGQGNFGSVDGDGAAAMRYTEAKLNNLALEMLKDLDKDTVDWENNFDDTLKEPKTLPSRFPNVLVNGGMGIAVGLATNIPPHNLGEVIDGAVAYINNPRIKLSEMMKYVPGPDFPTGGYIIAGDELEKAYETGKGKIIIRSKLRVEQESPTKQCIVVDEIPFQVNKASLIQKIGQLMVDKKEEFGGISDVVDESDRHGMRIVIKLRKDVDANDVLDLLYKNTSLQVSYGINLVMIADGKPQQLGLLDIFRYYTEYQKQVVLRRTKFDLSKAKLRHEIVSGLIIAVTDIDRVIQIIKKSPDTATAKQNLRKQYDLSDVQAQAILDLKLSRLTKLEIENLKEELRQLEALIKELTAIIESKKRLNEVVISEMLATKKKFKDARKTTILSSIEETKVERFDDEKPVENLIIGYSGKGLVRKVTMMSYSRSKTDTPTPAENFVFSVKLTNKDVLFAFTNKGNLFRISPDNIPEARGAGQGGVTFNSLFSQALKDEIPVAFFAMENGEISGQVLMFTKLGAVKVTDWQDFASSKSSCQAIKLKDDDEVLTVVEQDGNKDLFFVTEKGISLRAENEVPVQGRVAGGVKGIDLSDNDTVIYATLIDDDLDTEVLIVTSFGTFKKVLTGTITKTSRARKGVKIADLGDEKLNECVVFAKCQKQVDKALLTVIDRIGAIYHISTDDVSQDSRTTKGRIVPKIGACQPLVVYYARR